MGQMIFVVDAFTNKPFAGNSAGVCVMKGAASEDWMQLVAREMNHAETAFLYPVQEGYNLRWFTPKAEVPLCGHATLATSHILWSEGFQSPETVLKFQSKSGMLTAKRLEDGWIELDFPAIANTPVTDSREVLTTLHTPEGSVTRTYRNYLVELPSEAIVRNLQPDFEAVKTLDCQGVIVTAQATTPPYDFVSRYFAPIIGINEDPVTGSAHCALAPYWSAKLGKSSMLAYQASERGGEMRVTVRGERVLLAGEAVTTLRAELQL